MFKLCKGDPIVTSLYKVFRANIIRIPEERLQPLSLLLNQNKKLNYWGRLAEIVLPENTPIIHQARPETSEMAEINHKKTREIETSMGLDILGNFLSGFGLTNVPTVISQEIKKASTLQFSFENVERLYFSPTRVGQLIRDIQMDQGNPACKLFFEEDPPELFLIDSVITSNNFTISLGSSSELQLGMDTNGIKNALVNAEAKIKIKNLSGLEITFEGEKSLAFAFTLVAIEPDSEGKFSIKPAKVSKVSLEGTRSADGDDTNSSTSSGSTLHHLWSDEPGMIDVEG